jgi:hypothetical protein
MALMLVALMTQLALFGPLAGHLPGVDRWGAAAYVLSSAIVLVVVLVNIRLPGMDLIAVGSLANLAAIVANGGVMPAAPGALEALGWPVTPEGFSNSAVLPSPALLPLTDLFALPAWLPLHNVFSVGDVAIGAGTGWLVARTMRHPGLDEPEDEGASPDEGLELLYRVPADGAPAPGGGTARDERLRRGRSAHP